MAARFPDTLSFRLTLLYAAAFSIFLLAAFGFAWLLVKNSMNSEINEDLTEDIVQYRRIFKNEGIEQVMDEIKRDIKPGESGDEFIRIIDSHGYEVFSSDISDWTGLEVNNMIISEITSGASDSSIQFETQEIPVREFPARIAYGRIGPDIIIQIGESLEQMAEMLELLISLFLISFLIVIPCAYIFSWFITRRAVSGIEKVSRAAIAISNGYLDSHVNVSGQSREIQNLVDTFNSMAHRIRELITEMREMIDNIAHDLRTPLGRIRIISEMTLSTVENEACKAAASNTLEQCDKLLQYINATLDVAEAEAGVATSRNEPVDISAVTSNACELFETIAEEKNIKFTALLEPGCIVMGNRQNLQRMISNILDNALKYTPENGSVAVNLKKNGNHTEISISDTGIGIPVADQQRVFDRFFRCDQSRAEDGCGLGLSFARAVARSHNGDITLTSTWNIGSEFIISLPILQK